jgi:hypothetical protein
MEQPRLKTIQDLIAGCIIRFYVDELVAVENLPIG